LVLGVNDFIKESGLRGLLLCKESVIGFYKICNWKEIPSDRVHFKTPYEGVFTLVYNCEEIEWLEYADRNF